MHPISTNCMLNVINAPSNVVIAVSLHVQLRVMSVLWSTMPVLLIGTSVCHHCFCQHAVSENTEILILGMSRLVRSTGGLTSGLSDSLVSSRPQGGSGCSGGVLLRNHSWHSCNPPLHLVAQVGLAASAFPHPALARDAVWGSVHRCCCCEPAVPAHRHTDTHTQMPEVHMNL